MSLILEVLCLDIWSSLSMLLRIFEQMNSSCLSSGIQGSGDTLKDVAMARGSLQSKCSNEYTTYRLEWSSTHHCIFKTVRFTRVLIWLKIPNYVGPFGKLHNKSQIDNCG